MENYHATVYDDSSCYSCFVRFALAFFRFALGIAFLFIRSTGPKETGVRLAVRFTAYMQHSTRIHAQMQNQSKTRLKFLLMPACMCVRVQPSTLFYCALGRAISLRCIAVSAEQRESLLPVHQPPIYFCRCRSARLKFIRFDINCAAGLFSPISRSRLFCMLTRTH